MGERNRTAIAITYAMVPLAGSLTSLCIVLLWIWAGISLVVGRLAWRPLGAAAPLVWSQVAFFLALAAGDFINGDPLIAARDSFLRLFFLMPVLAVHRVALTRPSAVFDAVFRGAAIGGVIVPFVAIAVIAVTGEIRAQGFAGNPGPLSIVCLLTTGLALLGLRATQSTAWNALACLGAFGAGLTVVMTGMRGAWPALLPVLAIALWHRRSDIAIVWSGIARMQKTVAVLGLAALAALGVVLGGDYIVDRSLLLARDFEVLFASADVATTVSLRAEMYQAGMQAFWQRPLFGWGQDGLPGAVSPFLGSLYGGGFFFTHLHNGFLTVGVQAGLVGIAALCAALLSPVVCAWRRRDEEAGATRLAVSLVLVTAFLIPGLTNIMFFHDILDAVWALSVWTIAGTLMADTERTAGTAGSGRERP
ncbi:O-antigen ligase family protein [Fulvimarina sp. 2208YS6-2-32]|nr:O-antigen ligase family protein [Fulvimarina sp. 2208YS6-2-32]